MEASDSELMAGLAAGDDLALNELMSRWGSRVISFLSKMTGNRDSAVDLAQETFVRLYQSRKRFRTGGNFSTYLFTIAANLARNQARWQKRHPAVSYELLLEDGSTLPEAGNLDQSPARMAQAREELDRVHQAFLRLPGDLREAMSLFIYEDMGYAEIAAVCGCSAKAVETRIYRARQLLKESLDSDAA